MRGPSTWIRTRRSAGLANTLAAGALALAVVVGGGVWATRPDVGVRSDRLFDRAVADWQDPARRASTTASLRALNPEWDLMRRTFLGLALADRAIAHPDEADRWLPVIDELLFSIVDDEARAGQRTFLLDYADRAPFRDPAGRSVFVDGEVALVAGARRIVRDDAPRIAALHRERVAYVDEALARSPAGLPESYPDEAWLFCVTNALVAVRMADALDGPSADHRARIDAWTAGALALREPGTGLLGSSYTWTGAPLDGPEGSTVWLVATNLQLLDPALAASQYTLARDALVHRFAGLGWASEWGDGWRGPVDVDSGPIVPIVDASPSSSGFALLAARAFGDADTFDALARSLGAADVVVHLDPRLAVLADNPMGDAVLVHALTFGPVWREVAAREVAAR